MTAVSSDLLRKFDGSGSRYTSYPTSDRFVEACASGNYVRALEQRRAGTAVMGLPLSLYVHIPFCQSLCYFCACNKIITKNPERAQLYLRYLGREVDLYVARLGTRQAVSQLHLGGGTPTFFSDDDLRALMGMLRRNFNLAPGGEYSIEVDPRTVDPNRLAALADMGFNRLSLGVQDFDAAVQKAVHRVQETGQVISLVEAARRLKFESINIDLIYGLPGQTVGTWLYSLEEALKFAPHELYLYPLYVRPLTGLGRSRKEWDDVRLSCYREGRDLLLASGYEQVSMRMFRRADAPRAAGPAYCCQEDGMIGLGCGARSYTRSLHYSLDYAVQPKSEKEIIAD